VDDLDTADAWAIDVSEEASGAGATLAQTQPQAPVRMLLVPDGHPFYCCAAPDTLGE